VRVLILALMLSACSPLYRAATGRCPTLATQAADFAIGGAGIAISVDRYNAGDAALSAAMFGVGMLVGLGSNLSECR